MVTDYLSCNFVNRDADTQTHLYIGYHERQTRDRESGKATAITPGTALGLELRRDRLEDRPTLADARRTRQRRPGRAKRFVIAKGNLQALVYFWYHSRGRVIAQSHHEILYMFLDRAREGRTDSLVRFTVPISTGTRRPPKRCSRNLRARCAAARRLRAQLAPGSHEDPLHHPLLPPEVNAPANRTHEHCRRWVQDGHEVTVLTGVPNHPRGVIFDGYQNRLIQEGRSTVSASCGPGCI